MPRVSAAVIDLSEPDRNTLEKLLKRKSTPQQMALRAKIILRAANRESHGEIARALGVSVEMSRVWRRRWLELAARDVAIAERLQDASRPGTPMTFTLDKWPSFMRWRVTPRKSMPVRLAIGVVEHEPTNWLNKASLHQSANGMLGDCSKKPISNPTKVGTG